MFWNQRLILFLECGRGYNSNSWRQERQKLRFAYFNLAIGIYRSPQFPVLNPEIMDLSVNLWRRFSGQRSCKIWYVKTPWSKKIKDFTVSHLQVHPPLYLAFTISLLALSVIVAVGIVWCLIEHSKQYCHGEEGFQRDLCRVDQVFFAEGSFFSFLTALKPPFSLFLIVLYCYF